MCILKAKVVVRTHYVQKLTMAEEDKKLEVLWTPQQVAKYLGINPVTVYRWIAEKRMLDPQKIIKFSKIG